MTLETYTLPLDKRKVCHLLRRAGFGASQSEIDRHLGRTASEIVDQLIEEATDVSAFPDEPNWVNIPVPDRNSSTPDEVKDYNQNNRTWLLNLRTDWLTMMRTAGLREKMVLFWHNHFVTSVDDYDLATLAYRYLALIRSHAFGNLQEFVFDIGLTPAMLIYLNGVDNENENANENYGRELLELFTMGQWDRFGTMNYTQTDVQEVARALTGWEISLETFTSSFVERKHDSGRKTIFGRRGNYMYEDVVTLIFQERPVQVAYFICAKLYQEFVYEEVDVNVVQEMADLFVANNFDIAPVVGALLKSEAFYDDQVIGAKIKSPAEFMTGVLTELNYIPDREMYEMLYNEVDRVELGQILLSPPDVSGWPGYRSWISTDTLTSRWAINEMILYTIRNGQPLNLVTLFRNLPEASDPLTAFLLPVAITEQLLAVDVDELDIPEIDDAFNGDLIGFPIPVNILNGPPNRRNLAKLFLRDVPWYEWDIEEGGANQVLLDFVLYLSQLPEFQLT